MNKNIWIAFTVIFLIFACYHFLRIRSRIEKFSKTGAVKSINGLSTGYVEFVDSFNEYIDKLNSDNKKLNIITGIAYLATAATAFFSYFVSS